VTGSIFADWRQIHPKALAKTLQRRSRRARVTCKLVLQQVAKHLRSPRLERLPQGKRGDTHVSFFGLALWAGIARAFNPRFDGAYATPEQGGGPSDENRGLGESFQLMKCQRQLIQPGNCLQWPYLSEVN
jgi:hypothetical protein